MNMKLQGKANKEQGRHATLTTLRVFVEMLELANGKEKLDSRPHMQHYARTLRDSVRKHDTVWL